MLEVIMFAQLLGAELVFPAKEIDAWQRCMSGSAVTLEASGDSPEEVANAARYICKDSEIAMVVKIGDEQRRANQIESGLVQARAMSTIARACRREQQCSALNFETQRQKSGPIQ
jgi:NCAIR mutase (PurE)-related protein